MGRILSRWPSWFELAASCSFLDAYSKMEGASPSHQYSVAGCVLLPHLNAENTSMSEYSSTM